MKKLLTTIFAISSLFVFAQTPQGINYQSIIRSTGGIVIPNTVVNMEFKLYNGLSGALVYHESHSPTTNSFGMANLIIGQGSPILGTFNTITWSNGIAYEVYVNSVLFGTKQLFMSVPYAFHAGSAPAPSVSFTNNVLSVGGNTTTISSGVTYTAGNGISVIGNTISNIAPTQTLSITGNTLDISGGNSVFLPASTVYTAGNGIDIIGNTISNIAPTQTLSITGNTLDISGGNSVFLPASIVYTAGNGINVSGNTITNIAPTQSLSINADTLYISGGNSVTLPTTYTAGNGISVIGNTISNIAPTQTLSIIADTLYISGGNSVTLPTTYTAGNGIDITGGVITNIAPDQIVTLTPTGATTITGAYPNFTISVPNGTSLPNGFNGQLLFNNGTFWDTIPRDNIFFDGTNFGIGTRSPVANFHVAGYGRFDFSIATPQIYTDNIKITGGTNGRVLTSDAIGNGTWQALPNYSLTQSGANINLTQNGLSVATVTLTAATSTSLSAGNSNITLTQAGNAYTITPVTPAFTNAGPTTIMGTYPNYTLNSVPNPTLSIGSGSLSISNGNSIALPSPSLTINSNSLTINGPGGNTVLLPSAPITTLTLTGANNSILSAGGNTVALNTYTAGSGITVSGIAPNYTIANSLPAVTPTITGTGIAIVTTTVGNNFTVSVPNPTLSVGGGSISISGGNSVAIPSSSTTLVQGSNISLNQTGNTYTVNAPPYSLSSNSNTLTLTNGTVVSTATVPAAISPTITGTGIAVVSPTVGNNFNISVPTQILTVNSNSVITSNLGGSATITPAVLSYTAGTNTLKLTDGLSVNTITLSPGSQALGVTGNSLSLSGANTVLIPTSTVVAGNPNITVIPSGNIYSVSAVTPTLNVVGGSIVGSYPNQTINIPLATITGTGTGIATVTASVNNFTVNVPTPTYNASSGILSFGGTNVVVSPTLSLTGTTLTSGAATNSVNLSLLPGLWSASSTTAVVTTNTLNNVGIGTNNPAAQYKLDVIATTGNSVTIHGFNTGATDAFAGVYGENNNSGIGVYGQSNGGKGVFGKSTSGSGSGVYGESNFGNGGKFLTTNTLTAANAVNIQTNGTGAALFVKSFNANRFAGDFKGDVNIDGRVLIDSALSMSAYTIPPQPSNGSQGRIYYDRTLNKFRVSENSGAYVNLVGGSGSSPWIQGTGIITQTNLGDKVGIGTISPAFKLDVTGTGRFTTGIASGGQIGIGNSNNYQTFQAAEFGGLGAGINLQATGPGGHSYTMYSANGSGLLNFDDETVSLTRMVIDSLGKVGIGTIAPTSKLHVVNTGTASPTGIFDITNTTNAKNTIEVYNSGTGTSIFATNTSSTNATANFNNTGKGISILAVKSVTTTGGNVARFENNSSNNGDDAVSIYNNGTGAAIRATLGPIVAGSSNLALMVDNGHIGTTDAGTVSVTFSSTCLCGVSVTADAHSTDVAGTLRAVVTSSTGVDIDYNVTFTKPYKKYPVVIITPGSVPFPLSNFPKYIVSPIGGAGNYTGFKLTILGGSVNLGSTFPYLFNYMIIEGKN